ncbi:MAG: CNNM domain-containing protein, partial [Planctomycetota bacterium]|nr:CNNM domain-containing protein [Planctomycetota bacterium]
MILFVATSLLLVASACFSGAEAALFTLASHQGRRRSVLVAKMIDNKVEVLSVILLANQVVNLSFFA